MLLRYYVSDKNKKWKMFGEVDCQQFCLCLSWTFKPFYPLQMTGQGEVSKIAIIIYFHEGVPIRFHN